MSSRDMDSRGMGSRDMGGRAMNSWIDETGRSWPGKSLAVEHDGFAVMAFGMVRLDASSPAVSVCFAPERVSPDALQVARKFLLESPVDRPVSLRYYLDGWAREDYFCPDPAVDRIDFLTDGCSRAPRNAVQVVERDIDRDPTILPLISGLAERWKQKKGLLGFDDALVASALGKGLLFDRSKTGINYSWIGRQSMFMTLCGEEFCQEVIGKPYDLDPAGDEYKAVLRSYGATLDRWQPRYDQVRARMHLHPKEPQWAFYQRLLMPLRGEGGGEYLFTLCEETHQIAIPFPD